MLLLPGTGRGAVAAGDPEGRDRDEGRTHVADLGEQAVQLGLVAHHTMKVVVPSSWWVMVKPSNQADQYWSRCPWTRSS